MGAWDTGSFDNDDAMDWLYDLEDAQDFSFLAEACETVKDQRGTMPEAGDCAAAICAAEVVAALMGNPGDDLPDEVLAWVDEMPDPSDALSQMARDALHIVLTRSELKALWQESDQYEEWRAGLENLQERLRDD